MTLTSALPAACVVIDFGSFGDVMLALGIVAIPAVAVPVLAYIARRYPSQAFLTQGRRPGGIRMYRWGLAVFGTSLAGAIVSITLTWLESATCQPESIGWLVVSVIGAVIGSLLIGGGWAMAIRATWVVLATIAVLDVWIFYINLLFGIADPSAILGLVLLAFLIHGVCISLAARWSYRARDLGRVGRAKAGEAGRSLAAVWVFLASYMALTLISSGEGILDTPAGSAVIGALTLGALAVTMGSGYTKYAEAMYAEPSGPRNAVPQNAGTATDLGDEGDSSSDAGSTG